APHACLPAPSSLFPSTPLFRSLGRFSRQVSGFSLEHLLPENGRHLARMLVGTEGTLVTTLGATVNLVPVPQAPVLVALGYPDMRSEEHTSELQSRFDLVCRLPP